METETKTFGTPYQWASWFIGKRQARAMVLDQGKSTDDVIAAAHALQDALELGLPLSEAKASVGLN